MLLFLSGYVPSYDNIVGSLPPNYGSQSVANALVRPGMALVQLGIVGLGRPVVDQESVEEVLESSLML